MKAAILTVAMSLWGATVLAQESTAGNESESAVPAKAAADSAKTASVKHEPAFKLPPGFYKKKFGKHQLYCKKDAPMGTRIQTERCMNDGQMRDYLIALEEQKTNIDRIRATCVSAAVCSPQ
jgi:hypothetical protein